MTHTILKVTRQKGLRVLLMGLHRSGPLPAKTGDTAWDYPGNLTCLWFTSSAGWPRSAFQGAQFTLAWWALGESYYRKTGYLGGSGGQTSYLQETLASGSQL